MTVYAGMCLTPQQVSDFRMYLAAMPEAKALAWLSHFSEEELAVVMPIKDVPYSFWLGKDG